MAVDRVIFIDDLRVAEAVMFVAVELTAPSEAALLLPS